MHQADARPPWQVRENIRREEERARHLQQEKDRQLREAQERLRASRDEDARRAKERKINHNPTRSTNPYSRW